MDRNLSTAQVGGLFSKFAETDERFREAASRQKEFIRSLEKQFTDEEVTNHV
jgi:hypothetical protein